MRDQELALLLTLTHLQMQKLKNVKVFVQQRKLAISQH